MSLTMSTPQRPLPGAFMATPAASRFPPPATRPNESQEPAPKPQPVLPELSLVERAAKTINTTLEHQRVRYPELEGYIQQGISSDYVVAANTTPFQKVKSFPIPDKVLQQSNGSELQVQMGLFADINQAWVSLDNALYIWEYMHPDPQLIGYEDQPHMITAVRLVKPRAGVFIPAITRLLVVATVSEIILIGMSAEKQAHGGRQIVLYQTKMSVSVRGLDIRTIEGDDNTGRIFFSGSDNDVYEFHYQQEEKWFYNRCWKINHTGSRLAALKPSIAAFAFSNAPRQETALQMVADNSRNLLYTLSSTSTIRVFHLKPNGVLDLVITKSLKDTLGNIAHMIQQTELITANTDIVSIQPISSHESQRLHLVATTSTGCRILMSATSSFAYLSSGQSSVPSSMQVHHVRFPPSDDRSPTTTPASTTVLATQNVNTTSKILVPTGRADRYAPGYFLDFVRSKDPASPNDELFLAAPDTGQLARMAEQAQPGRFVENGMWMSLDGEVKDVGLVTEPFSASSTPTGFGNELAVQHDKPTAEIAILTHNGITTVRRLRLVDEFAYAVRLGRAEDGLEASVKNFIRLYGRSETAASALAVACGQGLDVTNDYRVATITDPDILNAARTAFIEYGGRPQLNENSLNIDQSTPTLDLVKPSPRHDGLALYVSRLIRSVWKSTVITESTTPVNGLSVVSTVDSEKLMDVQQDLTKLEEFLTKNKSFIDGLAGPDASRNANTKQDEVALQAEHRALFALTVLVNNMIEGISFVQMLFSERIEEIVLTLSPEARDQFRKLTFETLFCTTDGRSLAKDLVKSIVNRNIQQGHNVDTVADSLRRKCGSFCSAADVLIFKAQEQQKRAGDKGIHSELGRNLLNESLKLFKLAVDSLTISQLQEAVEQYIAMQFYAGAIELVLLVAKEKDRANRALAWIEAGRPEQDPGAAVFAERNRCYALVHKVIFAVDKLTTDEANSDASGPRDSTRAARLKEEAQAVIDTSEDEVFQTDLYDWYISNNQAAKLLEIQSPFLVRYLQRKATDDISIADLLWKYHTQVGRPYEAAKVQLELAKSGFDLDLDHRIEYLSRAKANASTYSAGPGRSNRQRLLREISEALEIATIQSDILQQLKNDSRLVGERRQEHLKHVGGKLLNLTELFTDYADNAGYHDICLLIMQAAGHRVPTDIKNAWQNLLQSTHDKTEETKQGVLPYEAVANTVRNLGSRLNLSETTFPVPELLPMLKRYAFAEQRGVGPETWVVDMFLELGVSHEMIFGVLQAMMYNDEAPFQGANRQYIANDILHVSQRWFQEARSGRPFGSDANANEVLSTLQMAINNGLSQQLVGQCQELRARINQLLR